MPPSPASRAQPPRKRQDQNALALSPLERVIGTNDLMSVTFLERAVRAGRSVGRVRIRGVNGQLVGFGTGSLVSPRLMLTNNHVLGSPAEAAASQVEFNFQDGIDGGSATPVLFNLRSSDFFLTDPELDYSLVAVAPESADSAHSLAEFGFSRLIEEEGKAIIGEFLNIIQHPNGEPKQVALRENELIDVLELFLHYHTDTAPGSSGSPVYNDQWELVALHHSGVPKRNGQGQILTIDNTVWTPSMGEHRIQWLANEGARISRIVKHVKARPLNTAARILRDQLFSESAPGESLQAPRGVPGRAAVSADGTISVVPSAAAAANQPQTGRPDRRFAGVERPCRSAEATRRRTSRAAGRARRARTRADETLLQQDEGRPGAGGLLRRPG